ncbi:MAG: anthranilate phosphoribosyltransferase [Candidatus Nitrosotenuis sp.]
MLEQLTDRLASGTNLPMSDMENAMDLLLSGEVQDAKKAEFLKNLAKKGETDDELYAMLSKMDERCIHISPKCPGTIIDVCGTGGDSLGTFNISTAASFVIAASGGFVAKHGNRSVSGVSGSADVFEYFGYDLNAEPQKITEIIEKHRIGFLFAPRFHPAMKNVAAARKILGTRTAFNLLGPLCNPARVKNQLIGVFSDEYLERIVAILGKRGAQNIMAVRSEDGLDELSTTAKSKICFLRNGKVEKSTLDPQKLGLQKATIKDLQISSKREAVKAFLSVLDGTANRSMQETTALNAAGGLIVGNIAKDFDEGLKIAMQSIKSGKAYSHFTKFVKDCGDLSKMKEAEPL